MRTYTTLPNDLKELPKETNPIQAIYAHVGRRFPMEWRNEKIYAADTDALTPEEQTRFTEKAQELGVL